VLLCVKGRKYIVQYLHITRGLMPFKNILESMWCSIVLAPIQNNTSLYTKHKFRFCVCVTQCIAIFERERAFSVLFYFPLYIFIKIFLIVDTRPKRVTGLCAKANSYNKYTDTFSCLCLLTDLVMITNMTVFPKISRSFNSLCFHSYKKFC